jgi:hypothetical protein
MCAVICPTTIKDNGGATKNPDAGGSFLRSVALDLFHQDGSNALYQPDATRGHRQELLGGNNARFDEYAYYPVTEAALCKPLIPIKFVYSEIHASSSQQINKALFIKIPNQQSGSASGA